MHSTEAQQVREIEQQQAQSTAKWQQARRNARKFYIKKLGYNRAKAGWPFFFRRADEYRPTLKSLPQY